MLCKILSKSKRKKKPHDSYSYELSAGCPLALFFSILFFSFLLSLAQAYKTVGAKKKEKESICVYAQTHAVSFVVMVRICSRIDRQERK